jgi:hypothetical protein
MPINGINNLYRVPTIKKERMPDDEQKKKKKKKTDNTKNNDNQKKDRKDGRIDIRI